MQRAIGGERTRSLSCLVCWNWQFGAATAIPAYGQSYGHSCIHTGGDRGLKRAHVGWNRKTCKNRAPIKNNVCGKGLWYLWHDRRANGIGALDRTGAWRDTAEARPGIGPRSTMARSDSSSCFVWTVAVATVAMHAALHLHGRDQACSCPEAIVTAARPLSRQQRHEIYKQPPIRRRLSDAAADDGPIPTLAPSGNGTKRCTRPWRPTKARAAECMALPAFVASMSDGEQATALHEIGVGPSFSSAKALVSLPEDESVPLLVPLQIKAGRAAATQATSSTAQEAPGRPRPRASPQHATRRRWRGGPTGPSSRSPRWSLPFQPAPT